MIPEFLINNPPTEEVYYKKFDTAGVKGTVA